MFLDILENVGRKVVLSRVPIEPTSQINILKFQTPEPHNVTLLEIVFTDVIS